MVKVIHQIDRKETVESLSTSFTTKFELVFALIQKNTNWCRFHLTVKANRKNIVSSKKQVPEF